MNKHFGFFFGDIFVLAGIDHMVFKAQTGKAVFVLCLFKFLPQRLDTQQGLIGVFHTARHIVLVGIVIDHGLEVIAKRIGLKVVHKGIAELTF